MRNRSDGTCSGEVLGAAIKVHRTLGPGLLESAYVSCLAHELERRGAVVVRERPIALVYEDLHIDNAYKLDLLVNDEVIVEVKAISRLQPIHEAQLLSYLRLTGHRVGLLLNFHSVRLIDGVRRLLNG